MSAFEYDPQIDELERKYTPSYLSPFKGQRLALPEVAFVTGSLLALGSAGLGLYAASDPVHWSEQTYLEDGRLRGHVPIALLSLAAIAIVGSVLATAYWMKKRWSSTHGYNKVLVPAWLTLVLFVNSMHIALTENHVDFQLGGGVKVHCNSNSHCYILGWVGWSILIGNGLLIPLSAGTLYSLLRK